MASSALLKLLDPIFEQVDEPVGVGRVCGSPALGLVPASLTFDLCLCPGIPLGRRPQPPPFPRPSSSPSPSPAPNCDPSYPTLYIAPKSQVGDLNCGDIPHRRFRIRPPAPHNCDGDNDGIGCES